MRAPPRGIRPCSTARSFYCAARGAGAPCWGLVLHRAGGIRMDYSTAIYENIRVPSVEPVPQVRDWSRVASVARVKAALLRAAQDTLDAEGYTQVVAPLLTSLSGACGDPGTLIPVEVRG